MMDCVKLKDHANQFIDNGSSIDANLFNYKSVEDICALVCAPLDTYLQFEKLIRNT